ncbi:hypothetical protein [Candidatus Albibeggiatoa sp. nov. NOAA]|uniref:hypothetical protein n=1 Tax=Candidatus Albibeggiatoa sp. nov. NOAA TaxID=3162724 RepID=UPI0032FF7599|nr:hypothetical protein [Thiotrichaceae bacterium]
MYQKTNSETWYFIAYLVLCFSIFRGIRLPSAWTYTHFLFNYDFGFSKRGLIGEVYSWSNTFAFSRELFYLFSALIFIANILLIYSLVKELIDSKNPIFIGISLVFISSLAIVFLSHIIGYFDHVGLLVTLVSLKVVGFYKKIIFLSIFFSLALLVHEVNLILFFPVIFMSLLLSSNKLDFWKFTTLICFSVFTISIGLVMSHSLISEDNAQNMYIDLSSKISHTALREDAFDVLHKNIEDNILSTKENVWADEKIIEKQVLSLLVTMPIFLFFIYYTVTSLVKLNIQRYIILLAILASLSPLLLHLVAWDIHRWNTFTITTSFLIFFVVFQSRLKSKDFVVTKTHSIQPIVIFWVFFNGTAYIPLFDGYDVSNFPFDYIIELIQNEKGFSTPYLIEDTCDD